jgi:ring-1,2-phenylacetyl-CoA epoxidase subunit PaaC
MEGRSALFDYVLRLGDTSLVLGQRLAELIGKAPQLEEEMAQANIALDLIGQASLFLGYAGEIEGLGRTADDLAFRRDVLDFRNLLIVEQPNGDFAHIMGRVFLVSAFNLGLYEALGTSADPCIADIALKAAKEVAYHARHSGEWVVRLGDGTDESRMRMQAALEALWPYTGELFVADEVDATMHRAGVAPDLAALKLAWDARIAVVLTEASLPRPTDGWMHKGGKDGRMHSEHLGYLLAEMQFLPRAYADAKAW